ncbi:MAG: alpha-amylase family glycosyl hydrolase [Saprospiraceae bacterium]
MDHYPYTLPLPEWAKCANIYEVNIRQYTPEGTFDAFRMHLPRLSLMGVDILWFMPVFPISETKKKGTLGSYYAVSDFRATNPNFGTMLSFQNVIDEAHSLGMKVILDWVPNHTGWDHIWIHHHPDYYTKDSSGHITDPINDHGASMGWQDVADLNYGNHDMREAMVNDMIYWLKEHHIDGFRHDMALLVPLDFWRSAIQKLRCVKDDLFMLAESEVAEHTNQHCFHAIYGWSLHHILNDVAQGKKNVSAIDHWFDHDYPKISFGQYMHFTSNHDENSWSGSEIERMGEAHRAFAALVITLDGIPLMYSGQEEPMAKRLEFFEKDDIGFKNFAYADFYTALHHIKHDNKALWNANYGGKVERVWRHDHIFAFTRQRDENTIFVVINLSNQKQQITLDKDIGGIELFSGRAVDFRNGSVMSLMPWEFFIFNIS